MEILNNGDEAREMAKAIEKTADTFSLSQVNGSVGCVDVSVEEDCVSSYERGISLTKQLIEHVQKASGYIQQINVTLQDTDLQAAAKAMLY